MFSGKNGYATGSEGKRGGPDESGTPVLVASAVTAGDQAGWLAAIDSTIGCMV